ncbi:MAG: YihA family ribosome biogenesis GTP-binding protein [Helicobacteraceae bacterium 4484_230]|nr:MAG: YihA family ribosome biogenesis GTP-binding protein [Helicobacteraceae bacterium 4484_230]
MIEIIEAGFMISVPNVKAAPLNELQDEVVFMARSNVGKSSLLNTITKRKNLAKVSSTPGKTRLINYFDVTFLNRDNGERIKAKLVDLPGFGYAKVSKSIKSDWEKNLTQFISKRKQIKLFVHLIDARHPDLEIDRSVAEYLEQIADESQYILPVFTKIDKLNQKEIGALKKRFPDSLMISNLKKRGIDKLISVIYSILNGEV